MRIRGKGLFFGGLFFILIMLTGSTAQAQVPVNPNWPDSLPTDRIKSLARPPLLQMAEAGWADSARLNPSWTIVGVGDIMAGTHYPSERYLPPEGPAALLAAVRPWIDSADVAFGNLEGTLIDEGGTVKRCSNPSVCYAFRSPESYGAVLREVGFDLLSLANNHSGDFGREGRERTKAVLDEQGIAYAGLAGTDEYAIIERRGLRVGLCAFAPNTGTCSIHDLPAARRLVEFLADTCDVVIVSFHGGAEGAENQRVPRKKEMYYSEDRGDVYRFAHAVVDAGADIVFGHGPHVTRAAELYRDRFIIYSLGNFCTYGRFNLRGPAGIAPLVRLKVDWDGRFLEGRILSLYQGYDHGPLPDDRQRALKVLRNLSKADFPESTLIFEEDGTISRFEPEE